MKKALALLIVVCAASTPLAAAPPSPEQMVPVLQELRTELERPGLTVDEDDYFKNLGRHLTGALARGFVKGWAENAAGAGFGHVLGTDGRNPMADRAIDGLVSTDISLPPEVPVFTPLVSRAMDAVIPPAE